MKNSTLQPYIWILISGFVFSWMAILTALASRSANWQIIAIARCAIPLVLQACGSEFCLGQQDDCKVAEFVRIQIFSDSKEPEFLRIQLRQNDFAIVLPWAVMPGTSASRLGRRICRRSLQIAFDASYPGTQCEPKVVVDDDIHQRVANPLSRIAEMFEPEYYTPLV